MRFLSGVYWSHRYYATPSTPVSRYETVIEPFMKLLCGSQTYL